MASGFKYGAKAAVTINGTDLSAYLDDGALDIGVDTAETTTFGATWKTFIEGLAESKFAVKGDFDPTAATGVVAVLTALIGGGAKTIVFSPAGTVSTELKRTFSAIFIKYTEHSSVADKVTIAAEFQNTGAITFGAN